MPCETEDCNDQVSTPTLGQLGTGTTYPTADEAPRIPLDEHAKTLALTHLAIAAAAVGERHRLTALANLAELLGIDRGTFYDEATAENLRRAKPITDEELPDPFDGRDPNDQAGWR